MAFDMTWEVLWPLCLAGRARGARARPRTSMRSRPAVPWPARLGARPLLDARGIGFLALGAALGVGMVAASGRVSALQNEVATLSDALPVGYAFGAGMVAAVNPCGVLLLPSAVAYYLTRAAPEGASAARRVGRALLLAAMATLGFVVLFAAVGLVVGTGGRALAAVFPVGGLLVGLLLVVGGAWLCLTGQGIGVLAASRALGRVELGDARSSSCSA